MKIIYLVLLLFFSLSCHALDSSEIEQTGLDKNLSTQYEIAQFYNQQGDAGHTMLHLSRAHSLAPLDKDVIRGMDNIRRSLDIPPVYYYQEPLASLMASVFLFIPLTVLALSGLILLIVSSVIWSLHLTRIVPPLQKKKKVLLITIFSVSVLLLSVSLLRQIIFFNESNAVIISTVQLQTRPDGHTDDLGSLYPGMECKVLNSQKGYYLIKSIDGKQGWVDTKKVDLVWPTSSN